MQTFIEHIESTEAESEEIRVAVFELATLMVSDETLLTEGISDELNKGLNKVGLKVAKSREGLIKQFLRAGRGVAQLMIAAIRGDKAKVKELSKRVKPRDVSELVFNMDAVDAITLGLIGPALKLVEVTTGWKLSIDKIKIKKKEVAEKIRKEIEMVQKLIATFFDDVRAKRYHKALKEIRDNVRSQEYYFNQT